jgi:phospholipid/cholesterol/gamma-HCH transport system ATP-binding protein
VILIEKLYVSFHDIQILSDISMEIPNGSICVLLGKNGSGKSVLLKAIAGLVPFQKGSIMINDISAGRGMYRMGKDTLGYVFQKGGLFDSMDVFNNIAFGMRRRGVDEETIHVKVNNVLDRVGLLGNENRYPQELSGGMQKRVCLARVLCLQPEHILYDDPTAGLDPILTDSIADLIIEIRNRDGMTSLLVSHDLDLVKKVADHIYLLYNENIVYHGSRNDFFSEENPYARQFINGADKGPIELI